MQTSRNNQAKDDKVQEISAKCLNTESKHRLNGLPGSIEETVNSFNLNEEQRSTLKNFLMKHCQDNNVQEAVYTENLKKLKLQSNEMAGAFLEVEQFIENCIHHRRSVQQQINEFVEKEKIMQAKLHQSENECDTKMKVIETQKYVLQLKDMEILRYEKALKEESMKRVDEKRIVESNKVKLLEDQRNYLVNQNLEIKTKLQRIESSLGRETVKKLQRKNDELHELTKIQKQRIKELSYKVSIMKLEKQIEKNYQTPSSPTN